MKLTLVENQKTQVSELTEDDIAFLSGSRLESMFRVRRLTAGLGYELYADNIVGALRLPSGRQLFIEPKLPLPNIFRMLSYVGGFDPLDRNVEYEKDEGLFDIIARIFASELSSLLRRGLRQQYTKHEAPMSSLRGRILFTESIKRCLIGSDKLYCGYSNLSIDTPINRAVVAAADALLKSRAIASPTQKQVRSCLSHIPAGAIEPKFALSDFKRIQLDRTTEHYRRILFLSRFILASASFSNRSGANEFPGFLLDLSGLFEKYVAKALLEGNGSAPFRVLSQKEVKLDREEEVSCIPDLTFQTAEGTAYIADTKYKNFSDLKFRNEDVFQVITYLVRHRCRDAFLIYPAFNERDCGLLKTIHVPTEIGEIRVHGVCIRVDTPEDVRTQLQNALSLKRSA